MVIVKKFKRRVINQTFSSIKGYMADSRDPHRLWHYPMTIRDEHMIITSLFGY